METAAAMTSAPPRYETELTTIEQFHITHCLYGEGVNRQAGFNVRASSTRDPLLLRFAHEYPFYRLPPGMSETKASLSSSPRRLALARIPGGKSALIHSVALADDSRGQPNNFFTHLLVRSGLHARDALARWGSPGWAISPADELTKDLPMLTRLPEPGRVSDGAVRAFLQPVVPAEDVDLATLIFPPRLSGSPQRRRELLGLALRGCLLALQASPAAPRARFYLLAEPGLTALLVYAAARLLPAGLVAKLTFSTYENLQRDLRTYNQTQIVGTYTLDPSQGLDEAFYTTRGYALDTFSGKASPELSDQGDLPLDDWLDLAGRGEWKTIDKVHRLQGKTATSLVTFKEALAAANLSRLVASDQAQAQDLIALKRSSSGAAILKRHRHKIWPLVRDGSLTDPQLRDEFLNLLRDHLPELAQRTADVLRGPSTVPWQPHWQLVRAVLGVDHTRLRETFQKILPFPPYPPDVRLSLLEELRTLELPSHELRLPLHALLRNCSVDDLSRIAASGLPPQWIALALCHAMARSETRAEAVRHLHHADDPLFCAYWDQFKFLTEETQRRVILGSLFPPADPQGTLFLSRLLKNGCAMRCESLEWLLDSLGAFTQERSEFWSKENHLGHLLNILRSFGDEAASIWHRLGGQINEGVLLKSDPSQEILLLELRAAQQRPGFAIPPEAVQVITDWALLCEHFEKASAVPVEARRAIIDASNRRGLQLTDVLTRYFLQFIHPQGMNPIVLDDFVGFFHTFRMEAEAYQDYGSRLIAWLEMVDRCGDEAKKAAYQRYYLEQHVPLEFRWRLAEETFQSGKLSAVVSQSVPRATEPHTRMNAVVSLPGNNDELFYLTGIRLHESAAHGFVPAIRTQLPSLLCMIAGGLGAALATRMYALGDDRLAALALFIPLVILVAENMALHAAGLAARLRRQGNLSIRDVLHYAAKELSAGVVLGALAGLVAGGVATAWSGRLGLGVCLGSAIAGGVASAAITGGMLPLLFRRARWTSRFATGPIVRALVAMLALVIFLGLASWLIS